MFAYPMLLTGQGFAVTYVGNPLVVFVGSLFVIPRSWFPTDMPAAAVVQVRLGLGMFSAFWIVAIFGIANGYAMPVTVRDVPIAYKRTSTPSDPKHMSYYVRAQVWPSSRDVYEVMVPRDVYDRLRSRSSRNGTFRASSSIP